VLGADPAEELAQGRPVARVLLHRDGGGHERTRAEDTEPGPPP
jgi:hypothetical protein